MHGFGCRSRPRPLNTANPLTRHAPPQTLSERQAIGRIAAVIWAAIAAFGALATVGSLQFTEMNLLETRLVVVSATVIAAVTFVMPWARLHKVFVNVLLITMAGYIAALAHASGAAHDEVTMLVTFAIALAVCFLPVRTSVAQVTLIAVLLAGGLFLLGTHDTGVQALRTSLLLSGLVVLCGLVLVLRSAIAEREAAVGHRIFDEDLLDLRAFRKRLGRELTTAGRNGRPVALVLLEIKGSLDPAESRGNRLSAAIGPSILERIRLEDSAGRLGGLLFGVIAPKCTTTDASHIAHKLENVVGEVLESLGHDRGAFAVATGWASHPQDAETASELLEAAREGLEPATVALPA
jgi:GGDEF domain-containing protein